MIKEQFRLMTIKVAINQTHNLNFTLLIYESLLKLEPQGLLVHISLNFNYKSFRYDKKCCSNNWSNFLEQILVLNGQKFDLLLKTKTNFYLQH